MLAKNRRVIRVPKDYYHRVHETRYQRIFGSGAIFRQRDMNSYVAQAWKQFHSLVALPPGAFGIEFGCGTGINTVTIFLEGFRMIGLDISPTAIHKANELARTHNFLDIFAQQDLRAYVTVVHHCLKEVVEMLMKGLGQDTSKIDGKSKGFGSLVTNMKSIQTKAMVSRKTYH